MTVRMKSKKTVIDVAYKKREGGGDVWRTVGHSINTSAEGGDGRRCAVEFAPC